MHAKHTFFAVTNKNIACLVLFGLLVNITLSGCDNNDKSNKTILEGKTVVRKYEQAATLHGTISNDSGAITTGKLTATNSQGDVVASIQLNNSDSYSIEIPSGTSLPLVLSVYPESDEQTGKNPLQVAVIEPTLKKYDISTLTTEIAKKARAMGGYNYTNLKKAAMDSTAVPDANKTTGGFKGDPTKQYGGWH